MASEKNPSITAFSKLSGEDKNRERLGQAASARPKNWRLEADDAETLAQHVSRLQSLHGSLRELESGQPGSVTVGTVTITTHGTDADPVTERTSASLLTAAKANVRDQISRLSQDIEELVTGAGYPKPEVADQTRND